MMTELNILSDEPAGRGSKRIKSVEIGYRVLLAVQRGPGAVKLSEVAKRCGLSSGAAHNYLTSLVNTGLVEQEERGRYRLGPSAFALSLASFRQLNGYDVMRDAAQALHRQTGQSTAVTVWSQGGPVSVYIQRSENVGSFEFRSGHLPMLQSGAGLLFMAYLAEHYTSELIRAELGESGNSDDAIKKVIAAAREAVLPKGYAQYNYEGPDHFALSAPVWTEDGRIPFILSIVVHHAVDDATCAAWIEELRHSAYQASLLLNRIGSDGPRSEICPNPFDQYA
ncbi:MAG TPA: helix-turn-helix domain-containing protein [Rhizorhapis sp.]|nr:helix-turn-helix domain-containing protein [Rhizorhapis sp.]